MSEPDDSRIIQLINLYGLAVDTQHWALFDRIFTADIDADFGGASHWRDLDSFKRDFALFHDPFDSTQHAMSNHLVHVAGDVARAFTNGNWRLIRRGLEAATCGRAPAGMMTNCSASGMAGASATASTGWCGGAAIRGQRNDTRREVRYEVHRAARRGRCGQDRLSSRHRGA